MEYKNGYKVVYEVAANGERTFYATKSNEYPPRDEAGNIVENEMNVKLATFKDVDFRDKTIYEYEGKFYKSAGRLPAYNEDGEPDVENGEELLDFSAVLDEEETPASYGRRAPEDVVDDPGVEDDDEKLNPEADPEDDEIESEE
jgi:hypothetical protein